MSEACEDFLRGQGRLASLLWELKPYEPPASLEASFLAAARSAQESVGAAPSRELASAALSLNPSPPRGEGSVERRDAAATTFEAPSEMAARFSQLAAQVDAAQAVRREAALGRIAAGDAPEAVLGAPVQPETADWLRQQASAAKPAKPPHKPVLWGFSWFDLRLAALATVLAAVATQWAQQHLPSSVEMALLEAFQREATPLAEAQPDQPQNQVGAAPPAAPVMARGDSSMQSVAPRASNSTEGRTAPIAQPQSTEALQAGRALAEETPAMAAMPEKKSALALEARQERAVSDAAEEQPRPAPRLMQATPKAMPAPVAAPSPPPLPVSESGTPVAEAESAKADIPAKPATAAARPVWSSSVPLAPAPAPAAPSRVVPARKAGEAPPEQASPEWQESQRSRAISINASLADEPARIAARLPERPAGRVWVVYQSEPRQAELATWLEALRQAMPETSRPARFELRSEGQTQDGHGKAITIRIVPPPLETPTR